MERKKDAKMKKEIKTRGYDSRPTVSTAAFRGIPTPYSVELKIQAKMEGVVSQNYGLRIFMLRMI